MQITQILQIFPFSRTGYIRVIRAIRVHPPAVQAEKYLWYPCFLCEIIISRTGVSAISAFSAGL
jgi:hypothetical protein